MSHIVIFPWIDRDEVKSIYNELFSKNVTLQQHAVDRLTVWKCRAMNRLPSAVESTAAFINAEIACNSEESVDGVRLQSLYSMALIRFVNHVTEKGQQGPFALPVHVVASEMGVPEWIVELRHDATHGTLPSVNELKAAATWALNWLRERFWEPQSQDTFAISSWKTTAEDMLRNSLVSYMGRKYVEVSNEKELSLKQTLSNIENCFNQLGRSACSILIEDGYFVFTEEQLNCLGYKQSELFTDASLLLPEILVNFWRNVINLLVKTNLIAEILLHISSVITERRTFRNALLCSWIYTLIWYNKKERSEELPNSLYEDFFDVPHKYLIEKCLQFRSCNENCDSLLNLLIETSSLNEEQKQQIKQLVAVCEFSNTNEKLPSDNKVHSVTDIVKNESTKQHWSRCHEEINWSTIPVGALLNQSLDYESLDLDSNPCDYISRSNDNVSEQENNVEMADICSVTAGNSSMLDDENCETLDESVENSKGKNVSNKAVDNILQWNDKMTKNIAENLQL